MTVAKYYTQKGAQTMKKSHLFHINLKFLGFLNRVIVLPSKLIISIQVKDRFNQVNTYDT